MPELRPTPLRDMLLELLASPSQHLVSLPTVRDLPGFMVARWCYWAQLANQRDGAPWPVYVEVDLTGLLEDEQGLRLTLESSCAQAAGGWLAIREGDRRLPHARVLHRMASTHGVMILLAEAGKAVSLLRESTDLRWAEEVRALHAAFVVATDPGLESQRRTLTAYARLGGGALVVGPEGSGRRTLAAWTARRTTAQAPNRARTGELPRSRVSADQAWIFEDVDTPTAPDISQLRALLSERALMAELRQSLAQGHDGQQLSEDAPRLSDAATGRSSDARVGTRSAALTASLRLATAGASARIPVVLLGERGVGKSTLAKEIHDAVSGLRAGKRGEAPFVTCDLGSLPRDLIESELFGIKRAATGVDPRQGLFKTANGGTIFLDELAKLPLEGQTRLLRVLQERKIRSVGSDLDEEVNVRVIMATNVNLVAEVHAGRFLPDLLDRISGLMIEVPPLRERPEDILSIARHHLSRRGVDLLEEDWIGAEARRILLAWPWPGNIRELEKLMEAAALEMIATGARRLDSEHLGRLAPARHSSGPVLATATSRDPRPLTALTPVERRDLFAVVVELPRLHERGTRDDPRRSVRHAVRCALAGRPIHGDALEALERLLWPGELSELTRTLQVLLASTSGPLTVEVIERALPLLLTGRQLSGIHLLLQPSRDERGSIRGAAQDFVESAVLLGRGGEWHQLHAQAVAAADGELVERLAASSRLSPDGRVAVLNLPASPGVSRASGLVTRADGALWVHAFANKELEIWATPLGDERSRKQRVGGGGRLQLGSAGLIEIRAGGADRPTVQLFAALSPRALADASSAAAAALDSASPVGTFLTEAPPSRPPPEEERLPRLSPAGRALLNDIILGFHGQGHFKPYLRSRVAIPAEMDKVLRYLDRNDQTTQQCVRLYVADESVELLQECAELAASDPERLEAVARLPERLRDLIIDRMKTLRPMEAGS